MKSAAALTSEVLADATQLPVTKPIPERELKAFRSSAVPLSGQDLDAVLAEVRERITPYPFGNGHGRFYA